MSRDPKDYGHHLNKYGEPMCRPYRNWYEIAEANNITIGGAFKNCNFCNKIKKLMLEEQDEKLKQQSTKGDLYGRRQYNKLESSISAYAGGTISAASDGISTRAQAKHLEEVD